MKISKRVAAAFLAITLIIGMQPSQTKAVNYDEFDRKTAIAGASLALKNYFGGNEDAASVISEKLAPIVASTNEKRIILGSDEFESSEEIVYDEQKVGVVIAENSLNVRSAATMLSDINARVYRSMQVTVTSEKQVNSNTWYKVDLVEAEGYVMSDYVIFGDEAEAFLKEFHDQEVAYTPLPTEVVYGDDYDTLPESVQTSINSYAKLVNFSLKNDYPAQLEKGSYLGMYSVLVYILENYQHILDAVEECGAKQTQQKINNQIRAVSLNRERLTVETGKSESDFYAEIEEAAKQRAEQARKEAEAAEQAWRDSLAYQISHFAEQYVGKLDYVWGGASLTYGADCSGFVGQVYAHFGLISQAAANMHAYDSSSLRSVGYAVSLSQIQPGDLVCYNGHVAIYYGNGVIVHAPSPGHKVNYGNLYMLPIITIRRLY